jgi:DNA (cytosine-5)-methyltransferase 1
MKLKVFENHGQDSRYRDMGEVCETVSAKYGTEGGNQPLVTPSKAQGGIALCSGYEVRRLMPIECERLQGMPDDWTRIPYRGKPAGECPDSPRYKAIGNSWAVPVIQWIGRRIDAAVKEQKND